MILLLLLTFTHKFEFSLMSIFFRVRFYFSKFSTFHFKKLFIFWWAKSNKSNLLSILTRFLNKISNLIPWSLNIDYQSTVILEHSFYIQLIFLYLYITNQLWGYALFAISSFSLKTKNKWPSQQGAVVQN